MVDRERHAFTSQLAIFRACPEIMSRLLKRGGSVLVAAKVLVISRLLHKKLSKDHRSTAYVESQRIRLARLRQILLTNIDKRLKALPIETATLLNAMCAYSLATSSSVTDVLRHFHQIRHDAMLAKMEERQKDGENVLQALQLWFQTIETTKAIIPKQLSSALLKLKVAPLFSNDDIRAIDEMDHEVHDKWIGEDILNFTPYVRHDDLLASKAAEHLATWAASALSQFQKGLGNLLESMENPVAIVELRKKTLDLWFSCHNRIKGIDRSGILDGFRHTFNAHLRSLIQINCNKLLEVTAQIRIALHGWQEGSSDNSLSLWDSKLSSMDTLSEAHLFLDRLDCTVYGKTERIRIILQGYRRWRENIEITQKMIEDLRGAKWEEDLEDLDDELIDQRQKLLSTDDPQELQSSMISDLSQVYTKLEGKIGEIVATLSTTDDRLSKDVFLLRLLREVKQRLPQGFQLENPFANSIRELQEAITTAVIKTSIGSYRIRMEKAITRFKVPQRPLWEGVPDLPTSPSPWAFKLLQVLATDMTSVGSDIWTKHATLLMKILLRTALTNELSSLGIAVGNLGDEEMCKDAKSQQDATGDMKEQATNDDIPLAPNSSSLARADFNIQHTFDLAYLDQATQTSLSLESEDQFTSFRKTHQAQTNLSKTEMQRLDKGVADYWKRTSLLFAFLA